MTDSDERREDLRLASETLIVVFEKVFDDFRVSIEVATEGYAIGDPRKDALFSMQSAIDMMDIPFAVRDSLGIPHPNSG